MHVAVDQAGKNCAAAEIEHLPRPRAPRKTPGGSVKTSTIFPSRTVMARRSFALAFEGVDPRVDDEQVPGTPHHVPMNEPTAMSRYPAAATHSHAGEERGPFMISSCSAAAPRR